MQKNFVVGNETDVGQKIGLLRGAFHPDKCPLCDQEDETIQQLLTTCMVVRQVWFR
jgi:hypothetical protein